MSNRSHETLIYTIYIKFEIYISTVVFILNLTIMSTADVLQRESKKYKCRINSIHYFRVKLNIWQCLNQFTSMSIYIRYNNVIYSQYFNFISLQWYTFVDCDNIFLYRKTFSFQYVRCFKLIIGLHIFVEH